jgi:hypothetical protein
MYKVAPLKSSLMLLSILGFLITFIYTDRIGNDWAFAMGFVFALIFVACMVSMTKAPIEMQLEMAPDLIKQPEKKKTKKKK